MAFDYKKECKEFYLPLPTKETGDHHRARHEFSGSTGKGRP